MSDYYVKKFDTSDHLVSMLFSTFANCTSLREVAASMLGLKGKTNHFQLKHIPYRSTLSDANKRRNHLVFQDVYYSLLKEYHSIISDSRQVYAWENRLEIIDSSTISLFKDILSCVGRKSNHGKRKGGIKVHTQINLQDRVPKLVWFSAATTHDKQFLKHVELEKGRIAVFDKGYNDYKTFDEFNEGGIFFVTRLKSNASYEAVKENDIPSYIDNGVLKDEVIRVDVKENGAYLKTIELRKVAYWDDENKRCFEFITNLLGMNAGPRQGLSRVARKGALALPAWRGGDLGSHRKPAGQPMGHRGQPAKARSRPKNRQNHFNGAPFESLVCPWPLCLACTALQHQSA
jgi:hypothetical protein